jgi:hypothetical protein
MPKALTILAATNEAAKPTAAYFTASSFSISSSRAWQYSSYSALMMRHMAEIPYPPDKGYEPSVSGLFRGFGKTVSSSAHPGPNSSKRDFMA